MVKAIDLSGERFGKLIVIKKVGTDKHRKSIWLCKCDCGNETFTTRNHLIDRSTQSCGCLFKQCVKERRTSHGASDTRLYSIWRSMLARCTYEKQIGYQRYGGRGVSICDEWRFDFTNFYEWAMVNGYSDHFTIDRIDVNGNYEPCNCRWVTQKEQSNNKTNNHFLTYMGKTQTMSQWAEELGINSSTLESRINQYHWDVEKALTTPVRR